MDFAIVSGPILTAGKPVGLNANQKCRPQFLR